jgi:hypothetical protein
MRTPATRARSASINADAARVSPSDTACSHTAPGALDAPNPSRSRHARR